jgi:photosystem II stability/assembly factor-like uncharacterized protein
VFLAALFLLSCRKPGGDQSGSPSPAPAAARPAHWEVAYRSPQSLNQPEIRLWFFTSISVVSPSIVFVSADYPTVGDWDKRVGYIVRTTDGGATWTEAPLQIKGIDLAALNSIKFVSPSAGFAVGVDESGYTVAFKTTDGGQSWTGKRTAFKQSATTVFFNDDKGWMGGSTGTPDDPDASGGPSDILATADAGSTWSSQYHLPVSISDLSFVGPSAGWAAGTPASIYHTTNGRIWSPQQTGFEGKQGATPATQYAIRRVDFVDELHGWAAAVNQAVIRDDKRAVVLGTTNGGANWGPLWLLQGETLSDMHFLNQQEGWAATDSGEFIYHTIDGGHRWLSEEIKFPVHLTFSRIGAADSSHVWAVGAGVIIRRVED